VSQGKVNRADQRARIGYAGRVPSAVFVERVRTNLLTASDGYVAGHRYAALHPADQLELLNNQLRAFNRRLDGFLVQLADHEIYRSFPTVGRVLTAEPLTEIGEERDRYPTARVLPAEAGAAPVTLAFSKPHRFRVRWACNRRLRSTTTTWAYVLTRANGVARPRPDFSVAVLVGPVDGHGFADRVDDDEPASPSS
jgi:hypothetical protein